MLPLISYNVDETGAKNEWERLRRIEFGRQFDRTDAEKGE